MSELKLTTLCIPAADLGQENPLPSLRSLTTSNVAERIDASVPMQDRRNMGYGERRNPLPYRMQDNYNRIRGYNGVNALNGYPPIEIHSPLELDHGDEGEDV